MKPLRHPLREKRFPDWPLAVKSILGFWLFYAVTVVARAFLGRDPLTILENKSLTITAGIAATSPSAVATSWPASAPRWKRATRYSSTAAHSSRAQRGQSG